MASPQLEVINGSDKSRNSAFNKVRKTAIEGLNKLVRVLMESVDDALFDLADKVDNDAQRNMYFEALREIRLKQDGIKQNFDFEMHTAIDRFISAAQGPDDEDEEEELTLIELDDLEDKIAIDNIVSRARPCFEDDLFAVCERLKFVLNREDIQADDNPFDPKTICDSFHKASDLLETDTQVKLIFYKIFEKYVMNNLGALYREINKLFIENGVLPEFNAEQERMKQTSRFMASRVRKTSEPTDDSFSVNTAARVESRTTGTSPNQAPPLNSAPAAPGSAPAANGAVAAGGGAPSEAGVPAAPGSAPAANGAPAAHGYPDASGDGANNGVTAECNLLAALHEAVPTVVSASASRDGAGNPSGEKIVPTWSEADFLTTLTRIQTQGAPKQPVSQTNPQALKSINQQQIDAYLKANQNQVTADENKIIDVVSMLFDFFFDDEALPAPIKALIGRLQIPILKAAIIDQEFFNQKKHPARKLLDSISRASLGWSGNKDEQKALIAKIEKIVDFVVEEFDEDLVAFDYALADFEQFLKREDERIKRTNALLVQRERKREQKFRLAHHATSKLIHKITQKHTLNPKVVKFLKTTWSQVLVQAHVSVGSSSKYWKNLQRISTTLVWTMVPKSTEAERAQIIQTIPALLRAMSKGMDLIGIDNRTKNRVFKMLAREHARIVRQTSKNIVTRVNDRTVWPEDDAEAALAKAAEQISKDQADSSDNVELFADDSVTIISAAPTDAVIKDLNKFTDEVKAGNIKIDDEIVLDSGADDDEFEEHLDQTNDEAHQWASRVEIGTWVEFKEPETTKVQVARLSWRSNVTGNLVFVNRQGQKLKNLTTHMLASDMREGRVRTIESSSVFDRAINTIMSKSKK